MIFGEQTMDSLISQSLARRQFSMILLLVFAGLALLLASVGVYGVISYVVAQRSAEIGLRIALGARPLDVFHLILGGGGKLAVVGISAGVAGALALTRLMSSVLYGISATDPATFLIVAVVFMLVGSGSMPCAAGRMSWSRSRMLSLLRRRAESLPRCVRRDWGMWGPGRPAHEGATRGKHQHVPCRAGQGASLEHHRADLALNRGEHPRRSRGGASPRPPPGVSLSPSRCYR